MKSQDIAQIFREIAQMLELQNANPFRIRAYERAAQTIENVGQELERLHESNALTSLPGIGKDLAEKINEYYAQGTIAYYQELKKELPRGLMEMLAIPGLGPKTVRLFYDKLGIDTIAKLYEAAQNGQLRQLEGIKEKTEENILRGINLHKKTSSRTPLHRALAIAHEFLKELSDSKDCGIIAVAGSMRRRKETVKDIDILITSSKPQAVMKRFVALPFVKEVLAQGETKSSVIAQKENIQVDVRVVQKKSFGAALLYFTGSKEFNVRLRGLANRSNYKINEYGLFKELPGKPEKFLAGKTEEEIFSLMHMDYIAPELREGRGEIEAALQHRLPRLINLDDIRGDLHVHSVYSDGENAIADIAQAAKKRGYSYVGIADHSQSLVIANGLTARRLRAKIDEIKKINKSLKGIQILCGSEVDILQDGKLDYPDHVLGELDFVVAAIHSGFKQTRRQLTKRIIAACKNRYVNIIAHPTGVLWGVREAYELDFNELFKAARDYKVALEINAHPHRLDLNDHAVLQAKKTGVMLAINTDAHHNDQLSLMEYGLDIARRGWLEKKNVINCLDFTALSKWLKK